MNTGYGYSLEAMNNMGTSLRDEITRLLVRNLMIFYMNWKLTFSGKLVEFAIC